MKRNLTLFILVLFCFTSAFSQIIHTNFGSGYVIAMNQNQVIDVNGDGEADFYVNQHLDEIGFSPITGIGCFASPDVDAITNFGARQLKTFEKGEIIQINDINVYSYIDDERGSIANSDGDIDENWTHLEDKYIGVAVFSPSNFTLVSNGWLRVAVDLNQKKLIIKEMAFQEFRDLDNGFIEAGDTGLSAVNNLDNVLSDVSIGPNPVRDQLDLNFDFSGKDQLQISILDQTGQLLFKQKANGSSQLRYDTSNWTPGMYFVNFNSAQGLRTEKILVTK